MLGLCCCAGSSLVLASRGCSLVVECGLLTVAATLVAEHRLWGTWASVVVAGGFSGCGSRALEDRLSSCCTKA